MYITFLCMLSFLSLGTSFIKIYGVIISTLLLIISLVSFSRLWKIDYKRKTISMTIIVCIISFINSCIFSSASYFMNKKLNIETYIDEVKIAKVLQEHSSLENIIKYYILRKQAKGQKVDLFLEKVTDIQNTASDLNKYPPELSKLLALKSSKNDYYYINFDKLNSNFYISNKSIWVIDRTGKLYINATSF